MKDDKFGTLKMMLVRDDDFKTIMDYFFDHFAENAEFMARGKSEPNSGQPIVQRVAATAAIMLATSGIRLDDTVAGALRPIHLPEDKFFHGAVTIRGQFLLFFYFEDLDVGMICVETPNGQTRLARLTTRPNKPRQFQR